MLNWKKCGWKHFAATLTLVMLAAGSALLLLRWSVARDARAHVDAVERRARAGLIADLAARYEREGGWDFLAADREGWRAMVYHSFRAADAAGPRFYGARFGGRWALLDTEKNLLAGNPALADAPRGLAPPGAVAPAAAPPSQRGIRGLDYLPIESADKVVAYLAAPPRRAFAHRAFLPHPLFRDRARLVRRLTHGFLLAVVLLPPLSLLSFALLRRRGLVAVADSADGAPAVVVDEARRAIHIRGRSLRATVVEFNLFRLLYSRPGCVFSRQNLMDSIYADHRVVSDRAIDSHIKKLRKKIKTALADVELIHSVYGAGYKYEYRDGG